MEKSADAKNEERNICIRGRDRADKWTVTSYVQIWDINNFTDTLNKSTGG